MVKVGRDVSAKKSRNFFAVRAAIVERARYNSEYGSLEERRREIVLVEKMERKKRITRGKDNDCSPL